MTVERRPPVEVERDRGCTGDADRVDEPIVSNRLAVLEQRRKGEDAHTFERHE